MEDILASIRRIIAEEDEQEARSARRGRAEAEEATLRAEVPTPARAEPSRPEPSRPETPRSEPPRSEPPRSEAPRPETRRFRFEEPPADPAPPPVAAQPPAPAPAPPPPPPAPAKVDWSGLGGVARDPEPPAPSRPAPRPGPQPGPQDERLEEEFGWAERALGRPSQTPEPESRFEFEIPFRDSDDADLDADFGAILKSSAPKVEPPAAPPRVVEGAYGGRFVEEPPRPLAPPPKPAPVAPPSAAAAPAPAAEDPFARFLTPPPSAFDDGYTLDPEAELLSGLKSEAADLGRKTEEAASVARRAVVDSADEAEVFLRRSASESLADLTEFAGGAAQTAKTAGRSVFESAVDFAEEAGDSAEFVVEGAQDLASEAASSLVEGARSAGRSVFETAADLTEDAGRALDKAADRVVSPVVESGAAFAEDAADLAGEALDSAREAGGAALDAAADLTKGAGRFFGEAVDAGVDFAAESAKEAADLAGDAAKAVGDAGRSAVKAVAETVEEAAPAIPDLPVFEPPKFDLPDFASLREEASRTVETTRREVDDIFGALDEAPAESSAAPLKEAESFLEASGEAAVEARGGAADLGDPLDVFGVDRFSREDLDEGVLNLSSDRRIPEAPAAEPAAAEPPPFDVNSFWGSDSDFEPSRDPASPLDIPPAPTEPESGFAREELLLTERLGEAEDPAALWETAAATGAAATAAASTALTTRAPAPPAAISARRSLIEDEDLLSEAAERASARAMAALTGAQAPRLHGGFPLPGAAEGETESLNAVVRQMLKPMLREWLDENLPGMVERLVRAEVERVSARAAWSDQT